MLLFRNVTDVTKLSLKAGVNGLFDNGFITGSSHELYTVCNVYRNQHYRLGSLGNTIHDQKSYANDI